MTPAQARQTIEVFRNYVQRHFGKLPYDKSTLPVQVIALTDPGAIKIVLPKTAGILAANPEMWLALADVIEEKLRELPAVH